MSYLKKIYLNWFVLGFTLGLLPSVVMLIKDTDSLLISKFWLLILLFIPAIMLVGYRKVEKYYGNIR